MISYKALLMIETTLSSMINSGKQIGNINFMVCPESAIAKYPVIETRFGLLMIHPSTNIPLGTSYLLEKPLTRGGIGFAWVSKKNSSPVSVGERPPAS